jgi:hypothetical protein
MIPALGLSSCEMPCTPVDDEAAPMGVEALASAGKLVDAVAGALTEVTSR